MKNRDSTTIFISQEEGGEWLALNVHSVMLPNGLVYDSSCFINIKKGTRQRISANEAGAFREKCKVIEYEALVDALSRGKIDKLSGYDSDKMKEYMIRWLKEGSKTG